MSSTTTPRPRLAGSGSDGPLGRLLAFVREMDRSALSGVLMLTACALALGLANSPWSEPLASLWATPLTVGVGTAVLEKPAILWINDGLMAVFFLLVGLEIKREVLGGELASLRKAALPVAAAIGGIAVPAGIYVLFTAGTPAVSGWAIPAATDIAFALGVLALLGKRVPLSLKIFLTTVAVVDDIGAVLVIAIFYTSQLSIGMLLAAAGVFGGLLLINKLGVRRSAPYVVGGVVLWLFVLGSGVHATVAGVLLALTIPAARRLDGEGFRNNIEALVGGDDDDDDDDDDQEVSTAPPHPAVLRKLCNQAEPLLLRWEHGLSAVVLLGIMPLFALANAGVTISGAGLASGTGVALGVGLGLLIGKPLGITLSAWLAVRLGLAEQPAGASWGQLHGAAWLAGIGFTMSLFIADLAFAGSAALGAAKIGLLAGSAVAALIGVGILVTLARRRTAADGPATTGGAP